MIIDLERFLAAGRPEWSRLESMLDKMEAAPNDKLSFDELRAFYRLYQRVSADLARAQTFASEPEITRYLESLTARAYAEIHETRGRAMRVRPFHWFWYEFPRVFRRHIRAFQLSLLITTAGAVFGAGAVYFDPDAKPAIIPDQFSPLLGNPAKHVHKAETEKHAWNSGQEASVSAYLMDNNIHVSIGLLAMGMTYGIGTIVLLFYNGVILGAVALDFIRAHETPFVLGWLMPHGVIELPATIIAGQAGLIVARALIGGQGRSTLKTRLREVGGDLMTLIGGVSVMLVWAGLVESYFSQINKPVLPYPVKIAFGATELVVLIWFLNRRLPEEKTA